MAKVLVLYYSAYGHIETMAYAVAEGAKSTGAEVVVKRVPELVPEEVAKASYYKMDQAAPIATVDELRVGGSQVPGRSRRQDRCQAGLIGSLHRQGRPLGRACLHRAEKVADCASAVEVVQLHCVEKERYSENRNRDH
ncbi:hypothetical protein SAMN05216228_10404 [Rhizobium tibeticum]|uniref:NAD(P)H dehydrogenase (Quinone) n=1 Tax=Rhizobium tibeticum TaxID=501024 RepID=A0A1H8V7R5_9HYPH|nr:NAD(P)H dehydrogenase (quinone) [Rhizobium tibeticum]SEP11512.1 hypothetical protein SAMN05216228_10404 [Rhizobium tibeticum]